MPVYLHMAPVSHGTSACASSAFAPPTTNKIGAMVPAYFSMTRTVLRGRSSLLWAGVQPTLDPSAETFMSVQCASSGRVGELVGVCGVCASCVGWRKG